MQGLDKNSTRQFRVLLYARVSTPQQAREGYSIQEQPEALRAYADAYGWTVVGEYMDAGRSGRTAARDGFEQLMAAVRLHQPDAVLTTRLSRFMRNARLTLNAVHEMRELGVGLICRDEPIDTRQKGIADLFLAILATMAEGESDRQSEYGKAKSARLVAQERWPGGPPPFGYSYDRKVGALQIQPDEAEVVRTIFSL